MRIALETSACWCHHPLKGASVSSASTAVPQLLSVMWRNDLPKVGEASQRWRCTVSCAHFGGGSSLIVSLLLGQDLEMVLVLPHLRSAAQAPRCYLSNPYAAFASSLIAEDTLLPGTQRQETIQIENWGGKLALKGKKEQLHCLNLEIWCKCFLPCSEQKYAEVLKLLSAQIRRGRITHLVLSILIIKLK